MARTLFTAAPIPAAPNYVHLAHDDPDRHHTSLPLGGRDARREGKGCTVARSMKSAVCKVRAVAEHEINICSVMVRTLADSRAGWCQGCASRAPPPTGGHRYRGAAPGQNLHFCMSSHMDSRPMHHPSHANVNPNRITKISVWPISQPLAGISDPAQFGTIKSYPHNETMPRV